MRGLPEDGTTAQLTIQQPTAVGTSIYRQNIGKLNHPVYPWLLKFYIQKVRCYVFFCQRIPRAWIETYVLQGTN